MAEENQLAFANYLASSPTIGDAMNRNQCGKSREYFGFDELFINDEQICEDIEQLKYIKDFDFLNDFFKQGSDIVREPDNVPELELVAPDRGTFKVLAFFTFVSPLTPRVCHARAFGVCASSERPRMVSNERCVGTYR
jgi:hypothetical protein